MNQHTNFLTVCSRRALALIVAVLILAGTLPGNAFASGLSDTQPSEVPDITQATSPEAESLPEEPVSETAETAPQETPPATSEPEPPVQTEDPEPQNTAANPFDALLTGEGDIVIDLSQTDTVDMSGWTGKYTGSRNITITGKSTGTTLTGLKVPLVAMATGGKIRIRNLIIHQPEIAEGSHGVSQYVGAIVGYADAGADLVIQDCRVTGGSIRNRDGFSGGILGWSACTSVVISGCSVTGVTIAGTEGVAGGIIGHAAGNAASTVTIRGSQVSGCTISSQDRKAPGNYKAGAMVATSNIGRVTLENSTAVTNTVTCNDLSGNPVSLETPIGRCVYGGTGSASIQGGHYAISSDWSALMGSAYIQVTAGTFTNPVPTAYLASGMTSIQQPDGTWSVGLPEKVAAIGDAAYVSLADAVIAAIPGQVITLLKSTSIGEIIIEKAVTLDLAGHTLTGQGLRVLPGGDLALRSTGSTPGTISASTTDAQNRSTNLLLQGGSVSLENVHLTGAQQGLTLEGAPSRFTLISGRIHGSDAGLVSRSNSILDLRGGSISGGSGIQMADGQLTAGKTQISGTAGAGIWASPSRKATADSGPLRITIDGASVSGTTAALELLDEAEHNGLEVTLESGALSGPLKTDGALRAEGTLRVFKLRGTPFTPAEGTVWVDALDGDMLTLQPKVSGAYQDLNLTVQWNDNQNTVKKRPDSLTFQIRRTHRWTENGVAKTKVITTDHTVSAASGWKYNTLIFPTDSRDLTIGLTPLSSYQLAVSGSLDRSFTIHATLQKTPYTGGVSQTGQWNWPIPVLGISGVLIMAAGLWLYRGKKRYENS